MRSHRLFEVIFFAILAVANLVIVAGHREHYTAAEELGIWPQGAQKLIADLDSFIELHEKRLGELKSIREALDFSSRPESFDFFHHETSHSEQLKSKRVRLMLNPVNAFVVLNRIRRVVIGLDSALDENNLLYKENRFRKFVFDLEDKHSLHEDHRGAGISLIRLQAFYHLNTTRLIEGRLGLSLRGPSFKMDAMDCFELGRLAYEEGQYPLTVSWMFAALERMIDEPDVSERTINEILDYMAIAAYELGIPEYALTLTQAWLRRDPGNERALENLMFYHEEIGAKIHNSTLDMNNKKIIQDLEELDEVASANETIDCEQDYDESLKRINTDVYRVGDDIVVKRLCREPGHTTATRNKCELSREAMHNGHFYPGLKMEILSETPKIVRIHDVISRDEMNHLRRTAKPKLKRSTIASREESDFRISKTAWLHGDRDPVVSRIERRISSLLNLAMDGSEQLQVVNYGLGGFYGPHMDSKRVTNLKRNETKLMEQLKRSDRMATILIYLSRVEAGGSTVFPRLNLTVRSIEGSAVVWFNILENGYSDERTLHTGCPVLLGTKWIATKWPLEEANSFRRPCKRPK